MADLNEKDIRVFVDAVTHYFLQLTREAPRIRGAYLETRGKRPPDMEYTGAIALSGAFRGRVYVTAPRALLRHLLVATNEPDQSHMAILDLIGEMANTLAGNARRHFGPQLEISIPMTSSGDDIRLPPDGGARPYIVSVEWKNYAASVVVDVQRSGDHTSTAPARPQQAGLANVSFGKA
ncbi:chemotaxis protein CheX [Denitromonas ohlonensis]|uniref:Chemotaxis protein CheX n=2 Tax=Denitromonas TaxID=139331 RepID=A0A557SDC3_9RHOO|nr:chemotaxis protein CheX [Denitromonas ohlonensis]TVO63543.1 chemotaxis protein CheX [Denitromonas ohlonensis]TVO75420.1 chemotaxis protein CheX [Denitromonas ohlonensis]